jgi:hypothetical protein
MQLLGSREGAGGSEIDAGEETRAPARAAAKPAASKPAANVADMDDDIPF